jgi:bifunctional polynucleotide phosphatase/kinase
METDAYFAHNVGLKFHWADDYFQFDAKGKIKKDVFAHHPLEGLIHSPEVKYVSSATKHLVVLSGAAASGKSSIARQLEGYALINRDTMKTDAKMKKAFETALAANQSIVVDNTNPQASSREPWLSAAKKAGYKTTLIFVDLPKPAAIFLNEYRYEVSGGTASYVPSVAYNIFYSKLERPSAAEADEVITTQLNVPAEVKRAMMAMWF